MTNPATKSSRKIALQIAFVPLLVLTAAVAIGGFASGANAQETTQTLSCQDVGPGAPEPLGDREGHSILTATASCHVDSGFMSGGILTGADIWEWNGPKAALLSASGVVRKPGGTLVYTETSATLELTMADGKMTGWTLSGRGTYPVATGDAAPLAGKSYTFTGKPTGSGGTFRVEVKVE
jgi:hypothetical protein